MAITYGNLYLDVRTALRQGGSASPSLEARELMMFATEKTSQELMRDSGLYMAQDVEAKVQSLVTRYLQGEPVAYLIGEWSFYDLTLKLSKEVLIPRPDTEVLVERALAFCREQGANRVLDLCAGSGCIGLAMASQLPEIRVFLGDLSEGALSICRENTRRNKLAGRVSTMKLNALAPPSPNLSTVDLIVSNPPYIPTADVETLDVSVKDFEPRMALDGGADGLDFYRAISTYWRTVLRPGGALAFEVGIGQAEDVKRFMEQAGFVQLEIINDLAGIPRVVVGTLPKK